MKLTVLFLLPLVTYGSVGVNKYPNPCDNFQDAPWCNLDSSFVDRAKSLVANLTVEEKSKLMHMMGEGVPRLDIAAYIWWSEALHGAISPFQQPMQKPGTCWPEPIGVGSSFNSSLFYDLGDLTSTEARGGQNGMGRTYWAPNVNTFRDPRWGRGQETPGEDPTLSSSYAINFVKGMQGSDASYLKVSACLKHFAAYSQETGRIGEAAVVTEQDMEDTYLVPFEAGIVNGSASGIMCSYNAETYGYGLYGKGSQNGAIPSCANKGLLTDLARTKWGFNGYVTSDCGAADYIHGPHNYTQNAFETVNAVLGAGVDTDCGGTNTSLWGDYVLLDLMQNKSTAGVILPLMNTALTRLFTMRMRLGHFDPPSKQPWASYGLEHVDTPANRALAQDAAVQGFVLLKNDHETLPISPTMSFAVVGPHAKATVAMLGNYHERATPILISPCDGITNIAKNTTCEVAVNCTVAGNTTCFDSKTEAAVKSADAVVVVIGIDGSQEAEGKDRKSILLPGTQDELVSSVVKAANGKPVIVLIISGSALDVSNIQANPGVQSIAWVGYPGQAGGAAIAQAIFGQGTRMWGKLPMTWYKEEFCSEANLSDYRMRPDKQTGYPGRTHRFYTGTPLYPFGYGLSYTKFQSKLHLEGSSYLSLPSNDLSMQHNAGTFKVTIENIGSRSGDEVVLLFLLPPAEAVAAGAPKQHLAAFQRVSLRAGEVQELELLIPRSHFRMGKAAMNASNNAGGTWKARVDIASSLETLVDFKINFEM
eukprot:m.159291 g.159291  ORF g.159291 m.159291 type:complete len:761 (+) comp15146_c1_seq7:120-2402(+)